jgi:hypothetical protein
MSGGQKTAGARNGNWRGGRSLASNGYMLVRVGLDHPLADVRGYAYEHRIVASKMLGRWVHSKEHVHHKDENKLNNDPDNLEVLAAAEHQLQHRKSGKALRLPGEGNPKVACECGCGRRFPKYDAAGRPRRFVTGHNPTPAPTEEAIRAALVAGPRARSALFLDLPITNYAIACCLSKMKKKGLVANDRGAWRLCG